MKKKTHNILLFILIFFVLLSIIILKPLGDLDEIWNYNFARNIKNGLVPYKDFNMLQLPLLHIICGIILKVTYDGLIIMRILAALVCSTIFYTTYKMFNLLNIRKEISIIFTFFIGYLFKDVLCIDYNYLSLLLVLMIIYKEIKLYNKDCNFLKTNPKDDLALGVLAGLSIITKQTSGLFICIVLLGNKLLFVRKKEQIHEYIKSSLYRFIGVVIPVLSFIIYLLINNAFSEFISYTILGVASFTNTIPYDLLFKFNILGIFSVLVPIAFIYGWIKSIVLEKNKKIYFLTVYGLAVFVICFPISNEIHFLIGALPIIILIFYEFYNISKFLIGKIKINNKVKNFILIFCIVFIILFLIYYTTLNLYQYFKMKGKYSTLNHYEYIPINNNLENQIRSINEYILENEDVKILDASAAVNMISINRYNKNYDMLLKGNLGHKGEEKIIQEIQEAKNTKYLILKDKYSKNWQTPLDIINYVKENKTRTGQIETFEIYE